MSRWFFLFFLSLINAFPDAQIFFASTGLSAPAFSGLEGGHSPLWLDSGCDLLHLRLCDALVDLHRCPLAHLVGDMRVGVHGGGAGYMAQDGGQRLDVHSMGQGIGCESMAQIVKANLLTSRMLQQCVKPSADCRGDNRQIVLLGRGE